MSDHRHYNVFGLLVSFRVLPEEVENKFVLMDALVPPGLGAPPNFHGGETEVFRVMEGEFDFLIDGQKVSARSGDTVVVPDGAVHAFTCTGARPGRLEIINAPGRMHVDFFRGVGEPMPDDRTLPAPPAGPPDMAKVMQVAEATGLKLVPPQMEAAR
ncbi:cupin domain-containing protein [Histidinibacterium lentulum]|uniref:Cupin domain-containing protein n=1 Tax=Histidinibacterium lentulum TaxID=2480588 RepID=A0A3N2R1C7_9RHOB|nr:cupin domain-containing protein [Histidinibacterium lentulum]ROU01275.1 cupin domain-containing protein [Histidinibacterium lentulum]